MKKAVFIFLFLFIIISIKAYSQSQVDQDSTKYWLAKYEEYKEKDHLKAAEALTWIYTQTYIEGDSWEASYYAFNIAGHYSNADSMKASMSYYNGAILLNSEEPLFYEFRGVLKHELGDYRGAIRDYSKASELSVKQHVGLDSEVRWQLYKYYGGAFRKLGKFQEAIKNYNISLKLLENKYQDSPLLFNLLSDVIFFNRGICYLEIDKINEACLDFSKAGELGIMDSYDIIREYCN